MAQFILSLLLATIQLPLDSTDEIHFNKEAKSWIDALEHCNSRGSLAEITNNTMWDPVKTHLTNKTTNMQDGAWIGLERSIFANNHITWKWVSNGTIESLTGSHWNGSFPIDQFNYHCGKIIWVQEKEFKLLDDSCHKELPFICQTRKNRTYI